ncbi:3'(2'),5'-bisphosphate nucleotidase CysQ [Acinetobacter sp. ANC 4779]|uniref:3'(2'),5'-bisphosphate nucleotidase CysQ family protein n=1 Tax=Acinetobacter sp. ANC 4779 TaxID=2529848 RepID=UPI00103C79B5|nr:3'(2'),5'-bisphosphate nucleotidase CysQ [Acinetobacter sp. ANC 4779]TCB48849.1 3'(2'),5'-bisphosphate nucleotidase CysQ [Acinetobacter sp. ANC 4779]
MFKITTAPQDALILQLIPIVTQACKILRVEYQAYCAGEAFDVEQKSDNSPVTQADYRVNDFITTALQKSFPQIPVLSEEGGHTDRKQWQKFWLLDPLDGTKEFLHKRPEFTINLSLVEGAHTTFAILAIPAEQSLYICPKQGLPLKFETQTGQWLEYAADEPDAAIQVGLSQSSQGRSKYSEYLEILRHEVEIIEFKAGSAYKFCMMLEGKVDIYPRFHPTSEWDTSAGQCLLERIGGGLVDLQGRPFLYNQRDNLLNGGFIAFKNNEMKKLAFRALGLMANMY